MGSEMSNAGAAIVDVAVRNGITRFYTVPGESFLEVLDAVERHPAARLFSTRHESGAAFMAEADAKIRGVPAVAMGTRAVGAANLAIGVHTALHDSTPMVVLVGDVETDIRGRDAFQEIDLCSFFRPIAKWVDVLGRADRAEELMQRAIREATSGRPGPAVLILPSDILGHPAGDGHGAVLPRSPRSDLAPADKEEIRARLERSAAPVVIAGGGCRDDQDALVAFAESWGAGVCTAFRRQDVFPNTHPLYLGHLGLAAPEYLLSTLRRSDLVIVVGSRLSEVTTQRCTVPLSNVVHIDIDPGVLAADPIADMVVLSDAGLALRALRRDGEPRVARCADVHAEYMAWSDPGTPDEPGLRSAREVVACMAAELPRDVVIANDAGNFAAFLHRFWRYELPRSQVAPTSGAMGYAVPAAIGAKLAQPERPVVAFVGDGGMLMTGQELETAVRYGIGITVIVVDNGLYGTIAMHQARRFGRLAGVDIGSVDFAAYARSLGAAGVTARSTAELRGVLRTSPRASGPTVIHVPVEAEQIAPGARLSDLLESGSN
jgi:acetolactate synthase I/II/III large subunit